MRPALNIIPRDLAHYAMNEIEFAFETMAVQDPAKQMNEFLKIGFFERVTKEYLRNKGLIVPPDSFGEPLKTFELKVPADYSHETYREKFILRQKPSIFFSGGSKEMLLNESFSRTSKVMKPGEIYTVKIFSIWKAYLPICLEFLKQQDAVLVGPQGLCLVLEEKPEALQFQSNGIFSPVEEDLLSDLGTTYSLSAITYTGHKTLEFSFHNKSWDLSMSNNHMVCFFGPKT